MKLFKRYEKIIPGHCILVDVNFLVLVNIKGKSFKHYQYTAIDYATRARVLKIYTRRTQKSAIDFVNYVLEQFPFRIHTIHTDNDYEFQTLFHRHCEDLSIRHVYIKPWHPHLKGIIERSHAIDQKEFYQCIEFIDDIEKLQEWKPTGQNDL